MGFELFTEKSAPVEDATPLNGSVSEPPSPPPPVIHEKLAPSKLSTCPGLGAPATFSKLTVSEPAAI